MSKKPFWKDRKYWEDTLALIVTVIGEIGIIFLVMVSLVKLI